MKGKHTKHKDVDKEAGRNHFLLSVFIVATFFTGVRFWLQQYNPDFTVKKVDFRGASLRAAEIPDITGDEAFSAIGKDVKEREPGVEICGDVISRFLKLQQEGVIPRHFPSNPFELYGNGTAAGITKDAQGRAYIHNTHELGLYLYDCAARGCDTFTFRSIGYTPGWNEYRDVEDKGYLFTDEQQEGTKGDIHTVRVQTTDTFHILSTLKAEQEWQAAGETGHSPAWADLTPEELQVLGKCLEILEGNIRPEMTRMQKAEALALYLCDKLEYHQLKDKTSVLYRHKGKFVIYALKPLISGGGPGRAICEGYAKTYGLLLTLCGVPSMQVGGNVGGLGAHAWNLVQTDQGWYHVDTTWMDVPSVCRKYFMCTDEELKHDSGQAREWPFPNQTAYPSTPAQRPQ